MKIAGVSLFLVALLGPKTVAPVHGQAWQPLDDGVNIFDAADEIEPDKFIVVYKNQMGLDTARSHASAVRRDLPNHKAIAATMNPAKAEALKKNPNIAYVEYDVRRYLFGVRGGGTNSVQSTPSEEVKPYGIVMVQADQLSFNITSPITVCIIDSGYNNGHEDLPTTGVTGAPDGGAGPWYQDGWGHGTHIAGTIAAIGNNRIGVVGVSPGVKLHIVRVFGDDGNFAYSSGLVAALDACRAAGANIVNLSLGGRFKNRLEEKALGDANVGGVLSVAAAGNDGSTAYEYPAAYSVVVSVAAIDSTKNIAAFSQKNDQVDLAAPGVMVNSTIPMGTGLEASLVVAGTRYEVLAMDGTPIMTVTGDLFQCSKKNGLGSPVDCEGASGKVCLIQRGTNTYADMVLECQIQGGIGVIIYNTVAGLFSGTLGGVATSIPSVSVSNADGAALINMTGTSATVSTVATNYAVYDGTSMAVPYVSGVAALVWSRCPTCTNQNIRDALTATAMDLGTTGRDNSYGYGLVQALDASSDLSRYGCNDLGKANPAGATCAVGSDCCSGICQKNNACK